MRLLRWLRTTIIILAITAGIYTFADYLVGLWWSHHLVTTMVDASRNEPDLSETFLHERALSPNELQKVPGQRLITPVEYHGTYFNLEALPPTGIVYRRTTNPPQNGKPERVVLMVGASALYGPEVPDARTLASQVSSRLNSLDPAYRYDVYNAGVLGADSTQDRDRVAYELSRGLKPYMVIAFDGPIDIVDGIYQGRPGQPSPLLADRSGVRGWLRKHLPINIARIILLWFHDRAVTHHETRAPAQLASKPATVDLTEVTANIYSQNLQAMERAAKGAGARFLAVLPPSPFSTVYDHQTGDLVHVRSSTEAQTPKLASVLEQGQRVFSGVLVRLGASGMEVLDLSAALKAKPGNVFIDWGHLNETGYGLLADRIAPAVLTPGAMAKP